MSALTAEPPEDEREAANTTRAAEGLARRRFTVAEIEAFVQTGVFRDDERFELIGGEIVPMSPKGILHERLKTWLSYKLMRGLPDAYLTTAETTLHLDDDTFLEPDFVVYDRMAGLDALSGETCRLAIEIAVSSLDYDQGRKAQIYADSGLGELWVIDGKRLKTRVFRDPSPQGYGWIEDRHAEDAIVPLQIPDFSFRLADFHGFES